MKSHAGGHVYSVIIHKFVYIELDETGLEKGNLSVL